MRGNLFKNKVFWETTETLNCDGKTLHTVEFGDL
jgi:hypothetical protein